MKNHTYLNHTPLNNRVSRSEGEYIESNNEKFYKISNYDQIRPFFISMVSHTDHWFFISSNGGLSAGRKSADLALFPYYTDDKITNNSENTGSKTILKIHTDNEVHLWEPFSCRYEGIYPITRNLYKNFAGNKIIFEETNEALSLTFLYTWQVSDKYGFIKTSEIQNLNHKQVTVEILDGIQNILPFGVGADLQNGTSNLANAYKRNELVNMVKLGIYSLSAMIIDKAEPSEALKATTVWSTGLKPNNILLSSLQLDDFRKDNKLKKETDMRAEPGAYFINSRITLNSQEYKQWHIVADVEQDHVKIYELIEQLKLDPAKIESMLIADIDKGTTMLKKLVATADGLQKTADELSVGRHFSNVLFNIMRGGVFEDQYRIEKADLIDFVHTFNQSIADKYQDFFNQFDDSLNYFVLLEKAEKSGNSDLIRIAYEYLPLTFSRRHGDPSRPWNKFSIPGKNPDGSYIKSYEGNWRDIFQNWEALGYSFPGFILSMITKFVNASTIDGYNPYHITRNGIDWEVIDPEDPWSFIGYWGDHQIIYLLKLMELAQKFQKKEFKKFLAAPYFVYANVPYRIKKYEQIVENPQSTIEFENEKENQILRREKQIGADGKLVFDQHGHLTKANLTEKILVPLLTKMSNFIPEAGIWLNTQRPEWNDANNALVGNGVSMVTLYYMRRYATFFLNLLSNDGKTSFAINKPVIAFMEGIVSVLEKHEPKLNKNINNKNRRNITDELGYLGEKYREEAYAGFYAGTKSLSASQIQSFLELALKYINHSINANKRKDGLYHAYNLVEFGTQSISIKPLYEMLEGQVAVLSSGLLKPEEALSVLDALKNSKMYRPDQYSYILYPDRDLPRFLSKNLIPAKFIDKSKLAKTMIKAGNQSIIKKDINGNFHFNGNFHNAEDLKEALHKLSKTSCKEMVEKEYEDYLAIFEQIFNHKAFTGRSGTFFGYEGLGSIYWHMVSKLLLAVQENIIWARETQTDHAIVGKMIDHYYEIRAGIGINKSPELYGAFPTDPYSHTPGHKGAQQPGMTGQVKEDILNRWSELGIKVEDAALTFEPEFLNPAEFMQEPGTFEYFDAEGAQQKTSVDRDELCFTFCQVPIIYSKSKNENITIFYSNNKKETIEGKTLNAKISEILFKRTNQISKIEVRQNF
ncbi:hypothetical protein L21SP5_02815 [Salinivirga cyanobacteriivorans]|uniref:Cellobiose phosphorylase n=1 Tax=Salinivirga cyanobacteriivorans TaxID=1307839 RepID=A0A0S2I1Z0_9BACT|nr:hypothetical protein [Salinivirga cyanobacteriivorans]ALO16435.1 hypothetical protein L21SP5_02815 [Salinivirga cyanobacteriivorans]